MTVAVIPHTVEMTNLKSLKPGDPVNLEVDLIAKYVEKMIRGESGEQFDHDRTTGRARILDEPEALNCILPTSVHPVPEIPERSVLRIFSISG